MTGFQIEKIPFNSQALEAWLQADTRHNNWPVVYTISNKNEIYVGETIKAADQRPMLILHGDIDQRLDYQSSVDFYNYAKQAGINITLETFRNADHTEGMLSETQRYAKALTQFFEESLG